MNSFTSKKDYYSIFFFALCFTVCMQISGVPFLSRLFAPKLSLSSISKSTISSSSTTASVSHRVLKSPAYQDQISQTLLRHLMSSQKYDQLGFAKNFMAIERLNLGSGLKIAERVEASKTHFPSNAFRLQMWGKHIGLNRDGLRLEKPDPLVKEILKKISADTKGAQKIAEKYARAISAGKYGVIMDNEVDDLAYLSINFEDGILPRFIVVYGGFVELRYHAVVKFVEAACALHKIPMKKAPKVYRGFPQFSAREDRARSHDYEEGSGYIDDEDRVKFIEKSMELQERLKGEAPNTWKSDAWKDPVFKPGLDALRNMIDQEGYSAIAVLTCPAALSYLIQENPTRVKKFGVTMASPYSYIMDKKGLHYIDTHNSRLEISATNELLKSGVEFLGVGGGTAKTKGLRSLHDSKLGRDSEKLYPEVGLRHLEKVVSQESPFELFRIIAFAGHNVSVAKWRDWDELFSELWKFLEIEEPQRPGLKALRKRPQGVIDFLEKKAAQAREVQGQRTHVATASRSGETEKKDDFFETGEIAKATNSEKKEKKEDIPEVANWEFDRLMNSLRIWYLFGDRVRWQGPSADLHALITTQPYTKGLLGAVRYTVEDWPVKLDQEGKPVIERAKLLKFILSDHGNHYSVSDMNLQLIIDRLQKILDKYFNMMNETPLSVGDHIPRSGI